MNIRGRCQQIFNVLRELGPQSIRKLAAATGLPKSSVDRRCKGRRERAQQVPEAALWEPERGRTVAAGYWFSLIILQLIDYQSNTEDRQPLNSQYLLP